jgi:hypothetical protein
MKKIFLLSIAFMIFSSGCSSGTPGVDDVKEALATRINKKGCATSTLFNKFPIDGNEAKTNAFTLDALVNAGLLQKTNNSYVLSDLGKSAYDPNVKGFCYTQQYKIEDIKIVKPVPEIQLPPALKAAWFVSFKIVPVSVSDWVKNQDLLKAASLASLDTVAGSKEFTVTIGKKDENSKFEVFDMSFSFNPGIHFNAAWY